MNIETGKIVTDEAVAAMSPEQQQKHTPLTQEQYKQLISIKPRLRVARLGEIRHQEKLLAKRRAANKQNRQSLRRKH
jgi:hypothetical protein